MFLFKGTPEKKVALQDSSDDGKAKEDAKESVGATTSIEEAAAVEAENNIEATGDVKTDSKDKDGDSKGDWEQGSTTRANLQYALDNVETSEFPTFVKQHENSVTFPEKVCTTLVSASIHLNYCIRLAWTLLDLTLYICSVESLA